MSDSIYFRYLRLAGYPRYFRKFLKCRQILREILGDYAKNYDVNELTRSCKTTQGSYMIPPYLRPEEFGAWVCSEAIDLDEP